MPDKTYAKVVLNGTTYMDLTGDTVTPETMVSGILAHDRSGASITGTFDPSIFVTTNTDQSITGEKTFTGTKRVKFKQGTTNDKLGFTLYTDTNLEQGYLEYNPTNKIDNAPLFTLGNYASSANGVTQVGFRRYSSVNNASGAYNLLTPLIADARTPFNLTTSSYTNFYLPLGFTDGQNTVLTAKSGLVNLSTILPTGTPSISSGDAGKVLTVNSGETATEWDTLSYNSLTDKPTIPTALSQLTDDSTHRLVTDTEKSNWDNAGNIINYSYIGMNYVKKGYEKIVIDTSSGSAPYRKTYAIDSMSNISKDVVTKFIVTYQCKCTVNTAQDLRLTVSVGNSTTRNILSGSTFSRSNMTWQSATTMLTYNPETNKSYSDCSYIYFSLNDEDDGIIEIKNVKLEQQYNISFDSPYSLAFNEEQKCTPLYIGAFADVISSNQNLNSKPSPGLYICETDEIAATLSNSPTQHAFSMEVFSRTYKNDIPSNNKYYILQQLTECYNKNPKTYKRVGEYNVGAGIASWGDWYTDTIENDSNSTYLLKTGGTMSGDLNFGTTGKISETELKIDGKDLLKYTSNLVGRWFFTDILANNNLNSVSFCEVGRYSCATNAIATSLSNCPTGTAFDMEVRSVADVLRNATNGDAFYVVRTITTFGGAQYIQRVYRSSTNGTVDYGAWQKNATDRENTFRSLIGGFAISIPANANLNTSSYCNVGHYVCSNGSTLSNCPTTTVFSMEVMNINNTFTDLQGHAYSYFERRILDLGGNEYRQIISTNSAGNITGWGAWRRVNTTPASTIELSTQYTFSNSSYANVLQQAISATGWYAIEGSVAYTASMPESVAIIREASSGYPVVFSKTDAGTGNLGYAVVANLRASCISYLESGETVILRAKCNSGGKNSCTLKIVPLNY